MSPPQGPQQDSPSQIQISRKVKACAACRKQKVSLNLADVWKWIAYDRLDQMSYG
jgi:hypothetical protein